MCPVPPVIMQTELKQQLEAMGGDVLNNDLRDLLSMIITNMEEKDRKIASLEEHVNILSKKVNEIERYSSKDCIIINNLPLMHGSNYWVDILGFFHAALNIKVDRDQIVACHPLGPIKDVSNPPAFIVKFVYFDIKDRVWGRKHFLRDYSNPVNSKPVYLYERLTKRDSQLLDYMKGLGFKTTTNNCIPQVFVKRANGKLSTHNVIDAKDADSLLSCSNVIMQNKVSSAVSVPPKTHPKFDVDHRGSEKLKTLTTPSTKRPLNKSPQAINAQLKKFRNNHELLIEYIDSLGADTDMSDLNTLTSAVVVEEPKEPDGSPTGEGV